MRKILFWFTTLAIFIACTKKVLENDDNNRYLTSTIAKNSLSVFNEPLRVDSTLFFVLTEDEADAPGLMSDMQKIAVRAADKVGINRFIVQTSQAFTVLETDYYFSRVYRNSENRIVAYMPRIIMYTDEGFSAPDILNQYKGILTVYRSGSNLLMIDVDVKNSDEVIKMAENLATAKGVTYCEPEIISEIIFHNPLYPQQYYLRNIGQNSGTSGIDINVEPAWQITNGGSPSITVAVIDDGVDRGGHEDFGGRVLTGYTTGLSAGDGSPQRENAFSVKGHGTACAGIIGATNNNLGIRGVASNVNILPVNIAPDYATSTYSGIASETEVADAISWAWRRADILSISWSFYDVPQVNLAIDSAVSNGRNGNGCIVVASAGNSNPGLSGLAFPARKANVIAVGAIQNNGTIWNYSQRGAALNLVAPSGDLGGAGDVVTTDRTNNLGYDPGNYTFTFGGTSAACPQVAGVAALMLSVRPDLTAIEVRNSLHATARDLGPAGFDHTYGHGLVNAEAAVLSVLSNISGPNLICSQQATYTLPNLPAGASVTGWASTNTNVATISPTGVATKTGIGNTTFMAHITMPGGANVTASYFVNTEFQPQASGLSAGSAMGNGRWQGVPVRYNGNIFWNEFEPVRYLEFESLDGKKITAAPPAFYDLFNPPYHAIGAELAVEIPYGGLNQYTFNFRTRAYSACGISEWRYFTTPLNYVSGYRFSYIAESNEILVSTDADKSTQWSIGNIEVMDWKGELITSTSKNAKNRFKVLQLPKGFYWVNYTENGKDERQLLVVK